MSFCYAFLIVCLPFSPSRWLFIHQPPFRDLIFLKTFLLSFLLLRCYFSLAPFKLTFMRCWKRTSIIIILCYFHSKANKLSEREQTRKQKVLKKTLSVVFFFFLLLSSFNAVTESDLTCNHHLRQIKMIIYAFCCWKISFFRLFWAGISWKLSNFDEMFQRFWQISNSILNFNRNLNI